MSQAKGIIFCFLFLTLSGIASAEEMHFDPLSRNLIFVEGEAALTVPIDGVDLAFGFDIEKASFHQTQQESARIIDEVSANMKGLGLPQVEIIKGWDLVRQAKISLASKGRKTSNRLTIRIIHFPEGKLHELVATIIDKTLAVDGAIELENVRVFVSEEVENQKKEEALTQALKALQSNATRAAQAVGRNLTAPKRVFVTSEKQIQQVEEPPLYADYLEERQSYKRAELKSFVSIQKSFKVEAQIVDHLKITARVYGIYQLD